MSMRAVTFKYEKKNVKSISIAGSFSNWQKVPMKRQGHSDVFYVTLEMKPGQYQYKYVIVTKSCDNEEHWEHDPLKFTIPDGYDGFNNVETVLEKAASEKEKAAQANKFLHFNIKSLLKRRFSLLKKDNN